MEYTTELISVSRLRPNSGEIDGVPKNPRKISKRNLQRLGKSLKDAPEMLKLRELIVVQKGDGYIVIAGNQRLAAAKSIGMDSLPCKVLPVDTPAEKLREYVIKDNVPFGEDDWELLEMEWDSNELEDWGVDFVKEKRTEALSSIEFVDMYYDATRFDGLELKDCVDVGLFEKKCEFIDSQCLDDETKNVLKMLAYRFIRIDFEAVADYYTFNASETEKRCLERLRCVLLDAGHINGFIEDELLHIVKLAYNE